MLLSRFPWGCLAAVLTVSVAGPSEAAPPATSRGPDTVMLREITTRRDPVFFRHAAHLAYLGVDRCDSCHHREPPGQVTRCTGCHPGREAAKEAFHGLCKDCHRRVTGGGGPSSTRAPANCEGGGCHGNLVLALPGGDQPPVPFDHAGHRLRHAETCRTCHHADPPDTAPRACASCHKTAGELKAAFHATCIGCHVERSGGRPGAPSTKCGFCHAGPG